MTQPVDDIISDAVMLIREHPDKVDKILCIVYAKGIGAAMRAMGHWPPARAEQDLG